MISKFKMVVLSNLALKKILGNSKVNRIGYILHKSHQVLDYAVDVTKNNIQQGTPN